MASAIEPQNLLNRNGLSLGIGAALNGSTGPHNKDPSSSMPTPQAPPSPPATDTDTETDLDDPTVPRRLASPQGDVGVEADAESDAGRSSYESSVASPVTSPPYWTFDRSQSSTSYPSDNQAANNYASGHSRTISSASVDTIPAGGIILRDNENSSFDERGSACWAKSVEVTDYVLVNGSPTNIGAFVVWNIRVETLSGSYMNIRKRYSEFDDFRWRLTRTFPGFEAAVPELPPKSLISKFRPRFLEQRRAGLQYFLNCILLNPEFSGSPVLKEFLFS
ncbi:Phox homologous domain-containing protein [Biscogniauxia marginata]|nr:Phox homologous domain-containing protein [Biscogniauxia marginata]